MPATIGSLFAFILPRPFLKAEGLGLFNVYLEFLIKRSKSRWIEVLRKSKSGATILFSVFNMMIMCGMLKASCPNFWFTRISLKNKSNETATHVCQSIHSKQSCSSYLQEASMTLAKGKI